MKNKLIIMFIMIWSFILIDVNASSFTCEYTKDSNGVSLAIVKLESSSTPQVNLGLSGYGASVENVNGIKSANDCSPLLYYNCSYSGICTFKTTKETLSNAKFSGQVYLNRNSNNQGTGVSLKNGLGSFFNGANNVGSCSGYFGSANQDGTIMHLLKYGIFQPIKIVAPILLLVLTSLDFAKVVFSGKGKDDMEKAKKNFLRRSVATLIIFFAPYLVSLILTLLDNAVIKSCLENF